MKDTRHTPVFEITDLSQVGFPVKLYQSRSGRFSVLYGSESHEDLSYEQAAREFGLCLLHALAYNGKIEPVLE